MRRWNISDWITFSTTLPFMTLKTSKDCHVWQPLFVHVCYGPLGAFPKSGTVRTNLALNHDFLPSRRHYSSTPWSGIRVMEYYIVLAAGGVHGEWRVIALSPDSQRTSVPSLSLLSSMDVPFVAGSGRNERAPVLFCEGGPVLALHGVHSPSRVWQAWRALYHDCAPASIWETHGGVGAVFYSPKAWLAMTSLIGSAVFSNLVASVNIHFPCIPCPGLPFAGCFFCSLQKKRLQPLQFLRPQSCECCGPQTRHCRAKLTRERCTQCVTG